jgi:hypothetical protein
MKPLEQAVEDFRTEYLLKAVFEAKGHFQRAAAAAGIHRNTMTRILHKAGYSHRRVRRMLRTHEAVNAPKPVQSARPECIQPRRIA